MSSLFNIGGRFIGASTKPFVIAELSGNHNGSLDRALRIVEAAAHAGADAIKLQTYTADSMTLNIRSAGFVVTEPTSLWHGRSLYDLYREAATPWDWHAPLFQRCRELGMVYFSTPFDAQAVDFLESLNVPCYKIASFENVDHALIQRVAATGKPVIMSTGMATLAELDEAVHCVRAAGCTQLMLLKCTSSYPAAPSSSHLRSIPVMRQVFQCEVGLSDHTLGIGAAVAAVALGAVAIEKHITDSRAEGGVDAEFSLEPHELAALVTETERAWQALGEVRLEASSQEQPSRQFRRSLYIVEDMQPGECFTPQNLRAIRPGYGLAPKYLDVLLGKVLARPVTRGTPMSWDLLSPDHA